MANITINTRSNITNTTKLDDGPYYIEHTLNYFIVHQQQQLIQRKVYIANICIAIVGFFANLLVMVSFKNLERGRKKKVLERERGD